MKFDALTSGVSSDQHKCPALMAMERYSAREPGQTCAKKEHGPGQGNDAEHGQEKIEKRRAAVADYLKGNQTDRDGKDKRGQQSGTGCQIKSALLQLI